MAVLLVLGMVLGTIGPNVVAMAEKIDIGTGHGDMFGTQNVVVLKKEPTDPTGGFMTMGACTDNFGGVTTISVNTTYTGGTCTVTTAVNIQSGYTLRLEAGVLLYLHTSMTVSGTLEVVNSTISTSTASYIWTITPYSGSTVRLDNTTLRYYYMALYATSGGARIEVTNCNFQGGNYYYPIYLNNPSGWFIYSTVAFGAYSWGYNLLITSGSNFDVHNCVFTGSYYGIYLSSYSGLLYNTVSQNAVYYAFYMYYSSGTYTNNTAKNSMYGIYAYYGNAILERWTISGNSAYGMYLWYTSMEFHNCTITGSGSGDIYAYSMGTSVVGLKMVNCIFTTVASSTTMPVDVYWWTNFTVKWLSNSTPAEGADVTLIDNKGVQFSTPIHMEATGRMDWVPVMEYSQKGNTKTYKVPWAVNVTKKIGDKAYRNAGA
jgi:hypothetical protein